MSAAECAGQDAVLVLHGRLDASATPEVDAQLRAFAGRGAARVSVDLAGVSYVSSSTLRALLLAHRRQEALGGRLILANVPERVMRILRLCGFDRIIPTCSASGPSTPVQG